MTKETLLIPIDLAHELFVCDPVAGELIYRRQPQKRSQWNGKHAGLPAGWRMNTGYVAVKIGEKQYLRHRVIWAMHHGEQPPDVLDHENRVRGDDRISNLRASTTMENSANNASEGVYFDRTRSKWIAAVRIGYKHIYLGRFANRDEAVRVRRERVAQLRGGDSGR